MNTTGFTKMHRGVPGRMIAGVCAGVAAQLKLDVTVVRVAFALGLVVFFGLTMWVYALIWLLTPAQQGGTAPLVRVVDEAARLFTSSPDGQPKRDG
jgi:phage shock protein PspC (stress-responsive transcriptional regulator)